MKTRLVSLFFTLLIISSSVAQDTTRETHFKPEAGKPKWYKTKVFKASIAPAILIGYGISTIKDNGFYSSYHAKHDIQKTFGFRTKIDNYLIFAPYAELIALNLLKIKCRNDFINTGLLILKSELIMVAMVFPIKKLTAIQRPDSSDYLSFPSGHAAQAFVAASIIHKEFRYKSQWYGIGAYAIATSVGLFRMINNKHWESDVFAGAGVGILSAHIAYLTHKNRWGRKCNATLIPIYRSGSFGLGFAAKF
ncbi:MAG: phosphatase PAP2 family protein [Cytophagaceae bacterium]|nr:phosphatase PAP2 family protein [Cytophagaceae bacterium]